GQVTVVLFVALILLIGAISYFRLFDTYELTLLDLRFKSRPLQKINPQIAIVEIGDDTLVNLKSWPLPRDYHATLIKVLSVCRVRAVIFDVLFSEPQASDELLEEATKQAANVYYPYALNLQEQKANLWQSSEFAARLLPDLAASARGTGHANVFADRDGKRRRIPLFINYQGQPLPQLSLKAAADYLGIGTEEIRIFPGKSVQLGEDIRIPIDQEAAALVNLAGTWKDTFAHFSFYDILAAYAESNQGENLPPILTQLQDKICFVGLTATGTADLNATALEPVYPMVGLHANFFNSVLNNSFLRRVSPLINLLILYLLCLVSVFLTIRMRPFEGLLYQLGLLSVFAGAGFLVFQTFGLWLDLFFPLVACMLVYVGTNLVRYIKELHTRELLEKELSIARNIQRSFLQDVPQDLEGVDLAVEMDTAKHVGGDLYDFVKFPDGRIGLMVGDVSGKGVPAALFMAQTISRFRYFANICTSPGETLSKLNQDISRDSKSGLFVTMVYLIYDPASHKVNLA
ncbi:MAG: CHASE2 domain-containing protein, partial [Candidatus Omnitrophica bacterium]|nr:CHASE2 domain-containing protein [Candidatus Omnitrophota bacterium]